MEIKNFFMNEEIKLQKLDEKTSRKILAYNDNLMIVEVHFEKDGIGSMHIHPHEQITYVIEGEFEFTINGVKKVVKKGDSLYMQKDVLHGAHCLKKGVLLDIFTPHREDFLN